MVYCVCVIWDSHAFKNTPAVSHRALWLIFLVVQVISEGDGRVHVETTKGHCIFTIEGAERQDEGVYSVVVRNPAGEDTADINVKVVGKGVG